MLGKLHSLFWPCVCSLCYYNCLCRSYLPGVSIKGRGGWRGLKGERANTERQLHTWLCGGEGLSLEKRGIENGNPGVNINGRGKWV